MLTISKGEQHILVPASQLFVLMPPNQDKKALWSQFQAETAKQALTEPEAEAIEPQHGVQCTEGFGLYNYVTKKVECFKVKGFSLELPEEKKRALLNKKYQDAIQQTSHTLSKWQSRVKTSLQSTPEKNESDSLMKGWLETRTKERGAIRIGAELSMLLQWMDLECTAGTSQSTGKSKSFCALNQKVWQVKGGLDDLFTMQETQYQLTQKQLQGWKDIDEAILAGESEAETEVEVQLKMEATLWTKVVQHIVDTWKQHETDMAQSHQYLAKALEEKVSRQTSRTYLNLGFSLLDKVAQKVKVAVEGFFLDSVGSHSRWSLDRLGLWSVVAFVSAMFFSSPEKDFATPQATWNTLLKQSPKTIKESFMHDAPWLNYFFLSWSLFLDPIVLPSESPLVNNPQKSSRFRFAATAQPENEKKNQESPFDLLPFLPCDVRLKSDLHEIKNSQLLPLKLNIYRFEWNQVATRHFHVEGQGKNFLGHEVESTFPACLTQVKGFQCLKHGILKFYLYHIVPRWLTQDE